MRRLLPRVLPVLLVIGVAAVLIPTIASASSTKHLAGTWSGQISHAMAGGTVKTVTLRLTVDAAQTGGTWYVNKSCQGILRDDNISGGYHHFIEVLSQSSTCIGGATDCLQRQGANLFDNVTPPSSVSYSASGTFTRVKKKKS